MTERRIAVVTGSTSGIGLGVARALAKAGHDIVLNGFGDAGEIEKLRAGMAEEFDVTVTFQDVDMSKPDAIAAMMAAIEAEHGAIDVLVNNAGIQFV